jgi:hypothetical protein
MANSLARCLRVTALGLAVWGLAGCAGSPRETAMALQPNDTIKLSGQWHGVFTAPSGRRFPADLQIFSDGTYVSSAEAYSSRGVARVKDDKLVLVPEMTAGPNVPIRESTATLMMRSDGIAVLAGFGTTTTGIYSFELRRVAPAASR